MVEGFEGFNRTFEMIFVGLLFDTFQARAW